METDICTCSKTKADHANALATGACLGFALDRKATYWAEKNASARARSVKLSEDIKSGRVRPIRPLEEMVTREAAPAAPDREARKASLLGQLDALIKGDDSQHSGGL
jgi:hypothetical protein